MERAGPPLRTLVNAAPSDDAHGPAHAPLRCIVGPTAAGKSALAMQLARARGLAVVSADSRQVYQGFDIGTAKPSRADRDAVPHYGVDVVPPDTRYSAHTWAADAAQWIQDATNAGTPPLVVGGTGLYVKALVSPLDAVPVLDPVRRSALGAWLAPWPLTELERWCRRLDPARAHLGRTQLLRAIETAILAGTRLSDAFQTVTVPSGVSDPTHPTAPSVTARYLVVDPGPVLAARIANRVHQMIADGFVNEVERLRHVVAPDAPAWSASGYRVVRDAVDTGGGARALDSAIERVIIETRQYAKRQRTWFRHQLPTAHVTAVSPDAPDALAAALAWWDQGEADESRTMQTRSA